MKIKRSSLSSNILILVLAGFMILIMLNVAQAQNNDPNNFDQGNLVAQRNSQNQYLQQGQVLQQAMPQKSLAQRLWENTSLSYYQQFLGPTASGKGTETYNVFQEGIDSPNSGRAPLQSFHAVNLRHQINTDWAFGATLSASNGYTKEVQNKDKDGFNFTNRPSTEFFNARAYVSLPALTLSGATLFTTFSYEAPTSAISKDLDMKYGLVLSQNLAFQMPDLRWTAGIMGQVYRMYYKNNVQAPPFVGGKPTAMQTMIVSGGPYVNYRFSDRWMLGSIVTLDWDQRGVQSGSREFNNNLPHRGRVNLTYFPQQLKYLKSVGLFTQTLLKFRPDTTAFGADFSVRF
ncbi:MAG: hypothetical protein NDI69_01130 [Bacteriovoracaceae bacterium]|nr:hypothetical protein [Bacteriovoracaceae bacterium]